MLTDAATSVLASGALLAGITWGSRGLLARTGKILLDREMDDLPLDADAYRASVADLSALAHVSIEVNLCPQGAA